MAQAQKAALVEKLIGGKLVKQAFIDQVCQLHLTSRLLSHFLRF
jgi:hypothetical protein